MNVALISPNKDVYSETFIKAQKDFLPFNISFYYNGFIPSKLDGLASIISNNIITRAIFELRKRIGITKTTWEGYNLRRSLLKQHIEVVLAQYGLTGVAVLPVCKSLNIPLIVHFHGYDASVQAILDENKEAYKKMFEYASAIIVVSQKMETKILELGCPPQKIILNTYGPNESFYKINPDFNNQKFVALGRFTDKKAPYYTILAFEKVLKHFPQAKLTIGGDGALHNVCANLIKYLKITHAVSLPGVLNKEEFIKQLRNSIAFVQHSIEAENGDSEGTPVAILEASSAGLPIISTKHAGIPDVIIDNKTGVLVNEHDVDEMAEAMIKLIKDREFAKQIGQAGKKHIQSNFTMNHYISKLSETIKKSVV